MLGCSSLGDTLAFYPFSHLQTNRGVSIFCGKHDNAKIRAAFEIYGGEQGYIVEEDMRKFLAVVLKVQRCCRNCSSMLLLSFRLEEARFACTPSISLRTNLCYFRVRALPYGVQS